MLIINNISLLNEFKGLFTNLWIHIFIWLVIIDILTGIVKGFVIKESNSTKGLSGIIKHLLVIILVLTSVPYLNIAGFGGFADVFVWFYIAVYGISITENWGQLGLPLPSFVKDALLKLKDTSDKGNKE